MSDEAKADLVADAIEAANGTPDAPPAAGDAKIESERIFIMVTMPKDLFDAIDADAKAHNVGRATYARQLLATQYNITLPESGTTSRKKYESDEEREAARKKANQDRQRLQAILMAVHRMKVAALGKGQPIDEAAFEAKAAADYDAKQAAKAAKEAAEAAEKAKAKAEAATPETPAETPAPVAE
jgi:colicin import membrane protein